MMKILLKIDRVMAWILMVCMVLFFVSGYGLTKGIVDKAWSSQWHSYVLVYATIISFGYHSAFAAHLSFRRWKVWNAFMKSLMVIFYSVYLAAFIYIQHYYKRPVKTPSANPAVGRVVPDREFTLEELAANYNGKNGKPAYDAVNGLIYDCSSIYVDGEHYSCSAGKDNTQEYFQAHTEDLLAKYPVMGRLKKK